MAETPAVPPAVRTLAAQLATPTPMRRGSLSTRYVKCSKPGCPCATRPEARHGPYHSWTRAVAGRTRSRFLSAAAAELVRRQVAAGQQFRRRVDAYWAACEQWADRQLEAPAAEVAAEKRGSPPPSRQRSTRRSRRS